MIKDNKEYLDKTIRKTCTRDRWIFAMSLVIILVSVIYMCSHA